MVGLGWLVHAGLPVQRSLGVLWEELGMTDSADSLSHLDVPRVKEYDVAGASGKDQLIRRRDSEQERASHPRRLAQNLEQDQLAAATL